MVRWSVVFFIAVVALLFGSAHPVHCQTKVEFWETPRAGANYFNTVPDRQWFADASAAGIEWVRLAYDKWKPSHRDFLMGDAGKYAGLVEEDLQLLIQACDWAHEFGVRVVIVPLSLPGCRWSQNNGDKKDLRLWQDREYWNQAAAFWRDLAERLRDHPAVCAYNLLNEPIPEFGTGLDEQGSPERYDTWYETFRGTTHDLPAFYQLVIEAIRTVDSLTPIMVEPGWYAQPAAFRYWPRLADEKLLYGFHMYEPYEFTSHFNFKEKRGLVYPGRIPFAGAMVKWDKEMMERYLAPVFEWANSANVPSHRLVMSEFGCFRRNDGCEAYLRDLLSVIDEHHLHWAFYSFREDGWDGYDYELGSGPLGWEYWKAVERGEHPTPKRTLTPLFQVIQERLKALAGPVDQRK